MEIQFKQVVIMISILKQSEIGHFTLLFCEGYLNVANGQRFIKAVHTCSNYCAANQTDVFLVASINLCCHYGLVKLPTTCKLSIHLNISALQAVAILVAMASGKNFWP